MTLVLGKFGEKSTIKKISGLGLQASYRRTDILLKDLNIFKVLVIITLWMETHF